MADPCTPETSSGVYGLGTYGCAIYGEHMFDALVDEALARVLEQYKERPNLAKWLRIYLQEFVHLQLVCVLLRYVGRLEDARGIWLDRVGFLLSFPRVPGWSDEDYRAFLRVWITAARSSGTAPQLIAIALLLRQPGQTARVRYVPHWPKSFDVHLPVWDADVGPIPAHIEAVFGRIWPASVAGGEHGDLVLYDADGYFGFDEDPEASAFDVGTFASAIQSAGA